MTNGDKKLAWTVKSYGGYWGNLCFALLLRIGMYPAYFLLIFVAAFFVIFRRKACAGGALYLKKMGLGDGFWQRYKLVYNFGMSILDRVAFFSGGGKIICHDKCFDVIKKVCDGNRGVIVLTAHVGGWQIAGAHLLKYGRKVSIIGMDNEDEKIAQIFERERAIPNLESIGDTGEATGVLPAYSALKKGEIIAMHGDRFAGGRAANVNFLQTPANFPISAYVLASKTNAAIVQVCCVREKLFQYKMFAFESTHVENLRSLALEKRCGECAEAFADNLASVLKQYPYQWFNFYNFWGE